VTLAKNRMRWHKITEEDIKACLAARSAKEHSIKGQINCWNKLSEKFLRVSIREEPNAIVIISAVLIGSNQERV
jgi:hypothetical protein